MVSRSVLASVMITSKFIFRWTGAKHSLSLPVVGEWDFFSHSSRYTSLIGLLFQEKHKSNRIFFQCVTSCVLTRSQFLWDWHCKNRQNQHILKRALLRILNNSKSLIREVRKIKQSFSSILSWNVRFDFCVLSTYSTNETINLLSFPIFLSHYSMNPLKKLYSGKIWGLQTTSANGHIYKKVGPWERSLFFLTRSCPFETLVIFFWSSITTACAHNTSPRNGEENTLKYW